MEGQEKKVQFVERKRKARGWGACRWRKRDQIEPRKKLPFESDAEEFEYLHRYFEIPKFHPETVFFSKS